MATPTHLAMTPRQSAAFVAMLAEYESGTLSPRSPSGVTPRQSQLANIRFINNSGESIPAWGVMRITGATLETSSGTRLLTVAKPNTTLQRYYLVNSGDTCASSSTGVGTFLHHAGTVLYDTAATPAYGETWGPQDATWTIKKNRWGFNIVGGNTGSGAVARTVATQYVVNQLAGKVDASINSGGSGTISIWSGVSGSETDTTMNVTAWCLGAGVIQGQWVKLSWLHGAWHIGPELTNEQLGKPDSNIAKGASGTVSIWNGAGGSETDSGINVTAWAKGAAVTSGKFVVLGNMNGVWYVAPWEL